MFPPIFKVCSQNAGVTALLGTSPVRLYLFGEAPQEVQKPYAVWQLIGGRPENYINQRPDIDVFNVQVDVYANSASSARAVAKAIRDAVEDSAHITSWRGESRETETTLYRSSFDLDWFVRR